jgi:hypothetical protein
LPCELRAILGGEKRSEEQAGEESH